MSLAQQSGVLLAQRPTASHAMVHTRRVGVPLAVLAVLFLCQCTAVYTVPPSEVLSYGRFDRVYIYQPQARVEHLALLLSGDGGWSGMLGEVAQRLAAGGTLVAGVDVRHLLASFSQDPAACVSPDDELEGLAHYLQQHYDLGPSPPVLIGHSAGATLVFVALAQSRPGVFAGGLTLSFCADLDLAKPLCPNPGVPPHPRSGGVRLRPPAALPAPWIALHGLEDEVCPVGDSRTFATAIPAARFVPLPAVDHQYRHMDRWWPQFETAYRQVLANGAPQGAGAS